MRAIETQYKGYRFRSRLEARWAVFLDGIGVAWEYEPEGFELTESVRYLPDFYLPSIQLFLEIKGKDPTDDEYKKCFALAYGEEGACLLVQGEPLRHIGGLWCWDTTDSGAGGLMGDPYPCMFLQDVQHRAKIRLLVGTYRDRSFYADDGFRVELPVTQVLPEIVFYRSKRLERSPVDDAPAAHAARSARFEFGKSG